jgi:hypothetical protein
MAGRSGPRPCGPAASTTPLRCAHPEGLPVLGEWADDEHAALADLGYQHSGTKHVPHMGTPTGPVTAPPA